LSARLLYKDFKGFRATTSKFQPGEHKLKDYDNIQDILHELKSLHEEADRLAMAGADKESDDEDTL